MWLLSFTGEENGMKIILWIIAIIFIVGLLTLTGVFKLIF
ncbi:small membrane protein YohP [Winslowiella arboricola]